MNSIHSILDYIIKLDHDTRVVKATIIHVKGSAYRKEGATMLFFEDGRQMGTLSAGCLETALAKDVDSLLKNVETTSETVVYDMSAEDDLSWGRGAGCNGKIQILLEVIDDHLLHKLRLLHKYVDKGKYVSVITFLTKDLSVERTIYVTDEFIFGDPLPIHFHDKLYKLLETHPNNQLLYSDDLSANIFIHHYEPQTRLYIFGAGPDARPLATIASMSGFSVFVWDWRPAYLQKRHFPTSVLLSEQISAEKVQELQLTDRDFVVIMTHDFQVDQQLLPYFLDVEKLGYIGILGPRKRTNRLLHDNLVPEKLHSPVGLSISAEGPEEIAVSIMAQLIQTKRKTNDKVIPIGKKHFRHLSRSWKELEIREQ